MSKTRKVVKNLPARLPLSFLIVLYLLFDKFNAPDILWGAYLTIIIILMIVLISIKIDEKKIDIFPEGVDDKESLKKFSDRMKEKEDQRK